MALTGFTFATPTSGAFSLAEVIGKGASGTVYAGTRANDHRTFAIKVTRPVRETMAAQIRELKIGQALRSCANVVQCVNARRS